MPIRCPKCRMPALTGPGEISQAGRIMRCAGCETMWMARPYADAPVGASLIKRRPPVIDGQVLDPVAPRPRQEASFWAGLAAGAVAAVGRLRLAVLSLGVAVGFAAAALVPPAFSALSTDNREVAISPSDRPDGRRGTVTISAYNAAPITPKQTITQSQDRHAVPQSFRDDMLVFNWRLEPSLIRPKPSPFRLAVLREGETRHDGVTGLIAVDNTDGLGPGER